ncbi:MAG: hypothetical protein K0S32_3448 [Bacteroidetes bacterium]|jgi:hypothetical protein|nr:hypothetical protein [Bacteroidota bacterium]
MFNKKPRLFTGVCFNFKIVFKNQHTPTVARNAGEKPITSVLCRYVAEIFIVVLLLNDTNVMQFFRLSRNFFLK